MEYVYAALLLHSAGKSITEENLKAVLEAAGVEVNDARVKALVAALEGVNIDEAIQRAAMPMAVAAAPTVGAPVGGVKEEAKKEEKKKEEEEKKEEEAIEGLGALFG